MLKKACNSCKYSLSALLRSVFHRLKQLVLIHRHREGERWPLGEPPSWGEGKLGERTQKRRSVQLTLVFLFWEHSVCMQTGEILIRFCNFQDMLGQLRPRGRSLSPDFRLPRFLYSDVNDFDNDDHTTCDRGWTPLHRNEMKHRKNYES